MAESRAEVVPQDVINVLRGVRSRQIRARRGVVTPAHPRGLPHTRRVDLPSGDEPSAVKPPATEPAAPCAGTFVAAYDRVLRRTLLAGAAESLPDGHLAVLEPLLTRGLKGEAGEAEWTDPASARSYRFQVVPQRDGSSAPESVAVVCREMTAELQREHDLRRLASIVEQSDDAIIFKSLDGTITHWNRGAQRLYGYTASEAIGQPISILAPPDRADDPGALLSAATEGGVVKQYATARRRKNGTLVEVSITVSPIYDGDGVPTGMSVIGRDITAQRAAEEALRATRERFRSAFDAAPIGMALLTLDGTIEQANEALAGICCRPRAELTGVAFAELASSGEQDAVTESLRKLVGEAVDELALEVRFAAGDDALADVSLHGTLVRESADGPANVLCQVQDITQRKLFESQLRFMAEHDPLTGLLNRRSFERELQRHMAKIRREPPRGALLLLDLDQFKQVNDLLGHNAGDRLLVAVAGVLSERLGDRDVLARLGGDEFAILLPEADRAQAGQLARRILRGLRASSGLPAGECGKVTASIGIATFAPGGELSAENALVQADVAMYDAKDAGRDGLAFYRTGKLSPTRTKSWVAWSQKIDEALTRDRLSLAAQPIVDLRTGEVWQYELLLRMVGDHGELIEPGAFLDVAERFQLIMRLDEWVATRAIELLEQRSDLNLSVNISGHSLGDERLMGALAERLKDGAIEPGRLSFEVTETAAVAHLANARTFAGRLRALGCQLALDDFGAGFGSFYYLKHLPFDYVKIDGEFVQHVSSGKFDRVIVESVVGLARRLGCKTVAEFVTSEATARIVQRLGVDYAQGFHIGEPAILSDALGLELPAASSR